MLNLASETDSRWVDEAVAAVDQVLLDHAHCEKKAAGTAIRLLFQYPQYGFLQRPLSELAREELGHFERVLVELERRSIAFERQRPSAYGGRLKGYLRGNEPQRLLDWLLVCALIEARSCERFQLLADSHPDPGLAKLYHGLLASEARHHGIYLDLARQLVGEAEMRTRLARLASLEADALSHPERPVRLHSGWGHSSPVVEE